MVFVLLVNTLLTIFSHSKVLRSKQSFPDAQVIALVDIQFTSSTVIDSF